MATTFAKRCVQLGSALRTGVVRSTQQRHPVTAGRQNSDCCCPPANYGIKQSPIDICTPLTEPISLAPLQFCRHFDEDSTFCMYSDENTLHLIPVGSLRDMEGGPFSCKYYLVMIVFRWGQTSKEGSEHSFNLRKFPMEVQFLYVNYNYSKIEDALNQNEGIAMLSVLVDQCQPDPMFEFLVQCMCGLTPETCKPFGCNILCAFKDIFESERYYTYEGSVTFKPFCENVKWIVFEDRLSLSCNQVQPFREICTKRGVPIPKNFRCQQPLNGRKIYKMGC